MPPGGAVWKSRLGGHGSAGRPRQVVDGGEVGRARRSPAHGFGKDVGRPVAVEDALGRGDAQDVEQAHLVEGHRRRQCAEVLLAVGRAHQHGRESDLFYRVVGLVAGEDMSEVVVYQAQAQSRGRGRQGEPVGLVEVDEGAAQASVGAVAQGIELGGELVVRAVAQLWRALGVAGIPSPVGHQQLLRVAGRVTAPPPAWAHPPPGSRRSAQRNRPVPRWPGGGQTGG